MPALETMESVLVALWRASWQASWLILLVLLAQVTLRRWLSPAWRSALWLLVVARLLLPFTPPSAWSLFNLTSHFDALRAMALHPPVAVEANAHRSAGLRHGDVEPSYPLQHADSREAGTPATIPPGAPFQTAFNDPALGQASLPPVPAATIQASRGSWLPMLFWIWLTGVVTLSARIVCGALLLSRRIRRHAVVSDRRTSELLEESRQAIGTRRALELVETDAVDSPALFGLLRPKLLLPTGLIRRLDESELRHVFLHELAHLRRHDVLLNWLAALLQILHWFNPMIWFGFARMRADRELACDALALTRSDGIDRAAYGTTILKLVSDLTPPRQVAGLVGISEGKAHLKRRLRNIATYRKSNRRSTVTGTIVLLSLTAVTLTDARTNRDISELSAEAIEAVPAQFEAQERGVSVPLPEPSVAVEAVKAGPGRQRIEAKLQRTVLDEVQFDGLTLPDVVSYLGEVVRQQDPDREGINFRIVQYSLDASGVPVVDPTDMNNVRIWINPALRNVRLGDLLEAITRVADRPISYAIAEYGIVFVPRLPEPGAQLETRIYHINVEKLIESQRRSGPADNLKNTPDGDSIVGIRADGEESMADLLSLRRDYFEPEDEAAVDLTGVTSTNLTEQGREAGNALRRLLHAAGVSVMPPNGIYFKPRRGMLMVCATTQELVRLQQALDSLDGPGLRVRLAVRAIELDRIGAAQSRELGLDWFRGPRQAVGILTERQSATVLAALEPQLGEALVSVSSATAPHDRWTRVAWRSTMGREIILDCRPVVKLDGVTIELTGTIHVGGIESGEAKPFVAPESGAADPQESTRRAVVWTGQTMIWSGSMPGARSAGAEDSKGDNLLVFITPTIAEMAVGGLPSFDPDTIPPQRVD
ncbi:MAG: M56 family metallopeptidase [Verrucomicrobia bacterium]|nr:M56 family metallopeptidase [Verrucomicrobiota bacterium]